MKSAVAYARHYPERQIEFDAEPWFVNASYHDLQALRAELEHITQPEYYYFRGPVTNSIFHWIDENYPTSATRELADYCKREDVTAHVILDPDEALEWIDHRESVLAGRGAVDDVMRMSEALVEEMLRSSPARTTR